MSFTTGTAPCSARCCRSSNAGRPPATRSAWHLTMLMALIHAGSAELQARRLPEADAEAALVATVLGAVTSSGASGTDTA